MAGAVAVGAKVEIETMPGYLPTIPVDAPEELVEAAKLAAGDKYNVNVVDAKSTPSGGSTDVGRILRTFKIKKNVEVTDNGKIII